MRFLFALFLVTYSLSGTAQGYVRAEQRMDEGVFLHYEDYLNKQPEKIKLIKKGSDIFFWNESLKTEVRLDPRKVWGYSINGNVYISYEDGFWKLINEGRLNHFSAIVIRYYQSYDSFGFMVNRPTQILTHLFFDSSDGKILNLDKENFKGYFEEEPKLEKYYRKLKGNKTEKLILVLKAYNERHP